MRDAKITCKPRVTVLGSQNELVLSGTGEVLTQISAFEAGFGVSHVRKVIPATLHRYSSCWSALASFSAGQFSVKYYIGLTESISLW